MAHELIVGPRQVSSACPAWLAATIALVTLPLAGCVIPSRLDHPQDWGNSAALLANGCPDLSGTYAIHSFAAYPTEVGSGPPLNEILGPRGLLEGQLRDVRWPALPDATTATFTLSGDWLYVRFGNGVGGEATLNFKRMHWWGGAVGGSQAMYRCVAGMELGPALVFDASPNPIFAVPYASNAKGANMWFLSKGHDGALIVNYRTESINLDKTMMFGIWEKTLGSVWWRYAAIPSH